MSLVSDSERRIWQVTRSQQVRGVIWSQIWGKYQDNDDETGSETGDRLQASMDFIVEFLGRMDMDMIVEVDIARRLRHFRYESREADDLGYMPPNTRLFLIKSDGRISSI